MARIIMKPGEPMNTAWCLLGSVCSKDFDEPFNLARIQQLEDALRLQGVLPAIRMAMGGANQRKFCAFLVRLVDEDEIVKVNTRNAQEWNNQGHSSIYLEYLDDMAKLDLVKYNRTDKTLRPTASLQNLAKLNVPKVIAAAA